MVGGFEDNEPKNIIEHELDKIGKKGFLNHLCYKSIEECLKDQNNVFDLCQKTILECKNDKNKLLGYKPHIHIHFVYILDSINGFD